jgi:putative chitinase
MISTEQLKAAVPEISNQAIELFLEPLIHAMTEFEINTPQRAAGFVAQCAHESGNFRLVRENLNYSAEGLTKIFNRYFPSLASAQPYARNQEMIANRVYSNRMGNGDEASGDGFRYCGRGLIQLTGKDNYAACSMDLQEDLISDPTYLETPEGACRSAAWFWWKNNLNSYADAGDIVGMTKRINGGTIGLEDRVKHYNAALVAFGA